MQKVVILKPYIDISQLKSESNLKLKKAIKKSS